MKVRLNRAEFAEALGAVGSVAAARSPKPILQCTLFQAHADHCSLVATDLEVGIRIVLNQVDVVREDRVLVSAEKLSQIVRETTDDILEIEADGTTCHVRGKGSHFQIYCQAPEEFPPVVEAPGEADFVMNAGVLRRLAEWTVFSAAKESTRYAINGVLWDKTAAGLNMVATDGRRLSQAVTTIEGSNTECRAIVPTKAMHLFQRVMGDADQVIRFKVSDNQIIASSPRATVSAGLVEGQFPNYTDVIPSDCDKELELPTEEFRSAVRQAALLTNEESKGIRFALAEGELTLSSRAPEQGEATISMPVNYDAAPIEIGFNPLFLIDALRVVHTDTVRFELKDAKRPGILRSGDDLLYVVMPVNLS